MRPGDHACLAFHRPEERAYLTGMFVRDGLVRGERVVRIIEPEDAAVPGLEQLYGVDQQSYVDSGQLLLIDSSSLCSASGRYDEDLVRSVVTAQLDRLAGDGYAAIRFSAEWSWAACPPHEWSSLLNGETSIDSVIRASTEAMTLCLYDAARCSSEQVDRLIALHSAEAVADPLFTDSALKLTPTFMPVGILAEGEIDRVRLEAVTSATKHIGAFGGPVSLDLSGVEFIDLAALRMLFGKGLPGVVPENPPDFVLELLAALGAGLPAFQDEEGRDLP